MAYIVISIFSAREEELSRGEGGEGKRKRGRGRGRGEARGTEVIH